MVAVFFAAQEAEPTHAVLHAALGVACMYWAERLRARTVRDRTFAEEDLAQPELMSGEMDQVRRELGEMQERLDFAERMLSQRREEDRAR